MTTTLTAKYHIGMTVFWAWTIKDTEELPCPDCLGTQLCHVLTPGGTEFTAPCPRCSSWSSDLPRLRRAVIKPQVRKLTIGSIRIDTGEREEHRRIQYMCRETGVGSGSIYNEVDLFTDEETAYDAATIKAREQQLALDEKNAPQLRVVEQLSSLQLPQALKLSTRSEVWHSWYAFRALIERLEEELETWKSDYSLKEPYERIKEVLDFEVDYRKKRHPLEKLLTAAKAVVQELRLIDTSRDDPWDIHQALEEALEEVDPQEEVCPACGAQLDGPGASCDDCGEDVDPDAEVDDGEG